MLYDIWILPSPQPSPYTMGTWLGRWFGVTPALAVSAAAAQTGQSASNLQAEPALSPTTFQWFHP